MRNLADVSYPLRHVLRGIFAFLQDTIIDEFPWFVSSTKTLEILESKRSRGTLSAKHVASELLTFAVICAFLVVLVMLSLKSYKEDEDEEEERRSEPVNSETIEEPSSIGSSYTLALNSDDSKENLELCHDRGDSSATLSLEERAFANRIPNVTLHNFIGTVGPSVSSAREPLVSSCQQQHHHQREPQFQQRIRTRPGGCGSSTWCRQTQRPRHQTCRNFEWFVRRTRSGQIYGTYPF